MKRFLTFVLVSLLAISTVFAGGSKESAASTASGTGGVNLLP